MPFSNPHAVSLTSTNNQHMQVILSEIRHPERSNDVATREQHVAYQNAGKESSAVIVYVLEL